MGHISRKLWILISVFDCLYFIRYLPSFSFTDHFPHLYAHFFMLLHLTQMQPLKFALALCNCRGKSVFSQMCVGKLLLRHIVLTTFMLIFE